MCHRRWRWWRAAWRSRRRPDQPPPPPRRRRRRRVRHLHDTETEPGSVASPSPPPTPPSLPPPPPPTRHHHHSPALGTLLPQGKTRHNRPGHEVTRGSDGARRELGGMGRGTHRGDGEVEELRRRRRRRRRRRPSGKAGRRFKGLAKAPMWLCGEMERERQGRGIRREREGEGKRGGSGGARAGGRGRGRGEGGEGGRGRGEGRGERTSDQLGWMLLTLTWERPACSWYCGACACAREGRMREASERM